MSDDIQVAFREATAAVTLPERRSGQDRRQGDRRRGRPPLTNGEHASELTIRLPAELHDWLAQQAARQEMGVSTFARTLLIAARELISVSEKPDRL